MHCLMMYAMILLILIFILFVKKYEISMPVIHHMLIVVPMIFLLVFIINILTKYMN